MNRTCRAVALCLAIQCLHAAPSHAQTNPPLQWRPLYDPGIGGWVTALSFAPHDPSIILASGDILGVARSADAGLSWTRPSAPAGSYMLEEFTWHPEAGNSSSPHFREVWVGTMAGPWKSADNGETWVAKRAGMPQPTGGSEDFRPAVQKILVDPSNSERVLAFFGTHRLNKANGTYYDSGKVYESLDGGENWTALAAIVTDTDTKKRLITAASYGTPGVLYAASRKGFYKSQDNGLNWSQKSSGLPAADRLIRALAVHPVDRNILWVSVAAGGVYKSTDAGETWTSANSGISSPTSANIDAVVVSSGDGDLLYLSDAAIHKLYRSTDGGANWIAQPSAAFGPSPYPVYCDVHCFAPHPSVAGTILAGTATETWKTTNAGAPDDLDGVSPYSGPYWTNATSIAIGSGWAGTGFSGQVAAQFRWNPHNVNEAAMAAMDGGKFVSRDGLQTWIFAGGGRGKGINDWFGFRDFCFSANPGEWYATQGQQGTSNGLFRTINAGANWIAIPAPVVGGVTASGSPGIVVSHPSDTSRVWVAWGGKLYYSASAGAVNSWSQLAEDAAIYGTVADLVADPTDASGNTLWMGTSKGLFKTTDGTLFSQVAPSGTPQGLSRVKLDPTNANRLFIVNANHATTNSWNTGLWRLTNNAGSWTWSNLASWGNPSSPVKYIVDVAVDPTNGSRIVAATSQDNFTAITAETGVWVNDNNGSSSAWRREVNGLGVQRVRTVTFQPGTSTLVAGTMGGGYYIADTNGDIIDLCPVSQTFDLMPSADAEARRVGVGDGGGTVGGQTAAELYIGNANNSGSAYSPVYAFQLPSLGNVPNPFTTATFAVGLSTSSSYFNGYKADVYGLYARDTAEILPGDAFAGANDSSEAVKLQEDWINFNGATPVPTGVKSLSNTALVNFLNAQYAAGAGAGKFIFLRISPDSAGNTWKIERFAASENSITAMRPHLILE